MAIANKLSSVVPSSVALRGEYRVTESGNCRDSELLVEDELVDELDDDCEDEDRLD